MAIDFQTLTFDYRARRIEAVRAVPSGRGDRRGPGVWQLRSTSTSRARLLCCYDDTTRYSSGSRSFVLQTHHLEIFDRLGLLAYPMSRKA